jgi:hypothetical protein
MPGGRPAISGGYCHYRAIEALVQPDIPCGLDRSGIEKRNDLGGHVLVPLVR